MLKDYDKIIATAENEVLFLQFDEEHQLQYFGMLTALIMAYIAKEYYDKAFNLIDVITNYNFEEHPGIPAPYHKQLLDRKEMMALSRLFIYHKLNKEELFNKCLKQIEASGNKDRSLYAKMICLLHKPNKTNIKQLGQMLETASKNNMLLGYSNIHYLIHKEYEKYKYKYE